MRALRRLSGLDYEEFEDLLETVGKVADDWDDVLQGRVRRPVGVPCRAARTLAGKCQGLRRVVRGPSGCYASDESWLTLPIPAPRRPRRSPTRG